MPRSSIAIASDVYCGALSSSEGKGSIWVASPEDSVPTNTAPESVRYATKSSAVATSTVPAGVEGELRSAASSRSDGSAASILVSLLKLSENRYALSAVWATWLGLLMLRTVSSSPTVVLTRAYLRPSPVCSAQTDVSVLSVRWASRPGHTTLTPATSAIAAAVAASPAAVLRCIRAHPSSAAP